MLSVRNLTKIYKLKGKEKSVVALNSVSLDFPETGLVFLLGKSGSGKSTLLNTIGGLDKFDSGEVIIKGKSSKQFRQSDFDAYRNTFIGFIFQEYNILDEFSVGKNLALALELQGKKADKVHVDQLLDQVDLHGYFKRKPNQLSGGQKQRIAIARALIKDPQIIMADEPTGALDSNTGRQVMETLKKLSQNKLVIIVSHDREFAEIYGDRVIELKDGQVISDVTKHEVEAQKTKSGISIIDDKIIHIKKGQKVSKEDLLKVCHMIVDNSKNEDVIISFDKKPNQELKKTAFITDDGNREVFKETTKNDVSLKEYNAKDLKFIHSKMKLKDAFKMGTSSLKHKPIRLIFTILLSFIAFTMFGLVDTMASFNRSTATYESMKMLGNKTVCFTKEIDEGDYNTSSKPINDEDYSKISNKFDDYDFHKVFFSGRTVSLNGENVEYKSSSSYSFLNIEYVAGVLPINETLANDYEINLEEGRYPTANKEIVISKILFDSLNTRYKNIETLSALQNYNIRFNESNTDFKVVGIFNDGTDLSAYKNAMSSSAVNSYLKSEEYRTITQYGITNMAFVTNAQYTEMKNAYLSSNGEGSNYYYYIIKKEGNSTSSTSIGSYQFKTAEVVKYESSDYQEISYTDKNGNNQTGYFSSPKYFPEGATNIQHINPQAGIDKLNEVVTYLKAGVDVENLENNQIVIGNYRNYFGTDEELQTAIDSGLKIKLYNTYAGKSYIEFDVVGLSSNYWICNQQTISNLFVGYDYIFTTLKSTNRDRDLVMSLMNKDGDVTYKIQFQSTPILTNFSSTIESLSKVFFYIGIALAVFAGFMLLNFIATSISYKKREIGVLRAIGAGKKDVFKIFFSESFVIAMINFVLALVGTFVSCFIINKALHQDLGFTITLLTVGIRQVLLLFGISMGIAFVSTFFPVMKTAKKNPIDSINNR